MTKTKWLKFVSTKPPPGLKNAILCPACYGTGDEEREKGSPRPIEEEWESTHHDGTKMRTVVYKTCSVCDSTGWWGQKI